MAATSCRSAEFEHQGDPRIDKLREDQGLLGLAVGYVKGCAVMQTRAFGAGGDEAATPVSPRTAFEAGSVAKPVYAHLVMDLVKRGAIDLDAVPAATFSYRRPERLSYTHREGAQVAHDWRGA